MFQAFVRGRGYAALVAAFVAGACGNSGGAADAGPDAHIPESATALFALPGAGDSEGFFALPYPNDLRLGDDGLVDLSTLVRPNAFLADYFDTIEQKQAGFGLTAAMYMRFDGALDPSSLPSEPIRSQIPDASVYLVNVDTASATYGKKVPVQTAFHKDGGELIGDDWLSCLPYPGFVLEEETTYALVATSRLLAEDGSSVQPSARFSEVMSGAPASDPEIERAQNLYEPLLAWLDEEGGDEREDVVSAAVFTTGAPSQLMGRFRKVIHETLPIPEPRDIAWRTERRGYALYEGRYDSPNFQAGEYPYRTLANGGGFELDEAGDPIVQGTFDLRFSMTIPVDREMPENGWPVALYAHGTGGDYLSYESNRTAQRLAEQGIAVVSIDQVLHGDRLSQGDPQTLFFNFQNPLSSRANVMQAALEDYQLVRLVQNLYYEERHVGGRTVFFDPSKMYFFGHSQGSNTGVPFLAHEPEIRAAVLSGAGGLLYLTLITKTEPFDITALLGLVIRDREITRFHPALALLQAFYEPADAIVYGGLLVENPPEGVSPKNIFQPIGFDDNYSPTPIIEALATAIGLDLVAPEIEPIAGLALKEKRVLTAPVTDNAGDVTAIAAQFEPNGGEDGHFVSFDIPAARKQSAEFFGTLAETGKATVVAP